VVDRRGEPIRVGDRIRFQHTTGPYGQTAISEALVTEKHFQNCNIAVAQLYMDWDYPGARRMVAYHRNTDWDHSHETWAEVVSR
jgi:hypothetical protein